MRLTDDHDRDRDVECDHDHDGESDRDHDRDVEFCCEMPFYVIYTLKKKIFLIFIN